MHFERLILVPGHAIWSGEGSPADESTWFLKHFQTGEAIYLLDHIRAGVELATADPNALLIVSGGPSDVRAGARSEARAAFDVAEHYGWWGHPHVKARFLPEEYALDSFQNLLFGLCAYRMRAGAWPAAITVAGWGFKGDRFRHLHRAALRWTRPFDYIDVNDPPHVERASGFEQETCRLFETDPHGSVPPFPPSANSATTCACARRMASRYRNSPLCSNTKARLYIPGPYRGMRLLVRLQSIQLSRTARDHSVSGSTRAWCECAPDSSGWPDASGSRSSLPETRTAPPEWDPSGPVRAAGVESLVE